MTFPKERNRDIKFRAQCGGMFGAEGSRANRQRFAGQLFGLGQMIFFDKKRGEIFHRVRRRWMIGTHHS
jgi:hypothetical protein